MTRLATAAIALPVWWACGRTAVFVAGCTWMDDVTRGNQRAERRVGRVITVTGPVGLAGQLVLIVGGSAVMGIGARIADAIDRRRT